MFTSTKLHFSPTRICTRNPSLPYIFTCSKKDPTQHCTMYYLYPPLLHTYTAVYIQTPLLHCDIPGMPITPIATSQCNHVAKTNAFARISLHVPLSLLSFPISRITIFLPYSRSLFLSFRVSYLYSGGRKLLEVFKYIHFIETTRRDKSSFNRKDCSF